MWGGGGGRGLEGVRTWSSCRPMMLFINFHEIYLNWFSTYTVETELLLLNFKVELAKKYIIKSYTSYGQRII